MIDQKLINRKINLILKDFKELKPIATFTLNKYLKKIEYEILTERYLERIITRMIDINYHLIVELGNPPPPDYFSSFVRLGEIKVLPPDFARKIAHLAGFRNRLVHEYNSLDKKKVFKTLKRAEKEIPQYLKLIERFISKINKQKKLKLV